VAIHTKTPSLLSRRSSHDADNCRPDKSNAPQKNVLMFTRPEFE